MKTNKASLIRGLLASVLLTIGLTSFAGWIDPVMDGSSTTEDHLRVAGPPTQACKINLTDGIG